MSLTGDPDGPPTKSGLSLVDLSGGYASAIAMLAGLWRARRDGVGCDCDVSLFETALHELMYVGTVGCDARATSPPRRRNSAHPSIVPFQNFETADGWIVVACREAEVLGARSARRSGAPSWPTTSASRRLPARDEHRDELLAAPRGRSSARGRATSGSRCSSRPASRRRRSTTSRGARDPQTRARGRRRARAPAARARCGRSRSPLRLSGRGAAACGRGAVPRRAHRAGAGRAVRLRAGAGAGARGRVGVFGESRKETANG